MKTRGLEPDNTYLFIRGHNLRIFLINNILESVRHDVCAKHLREIGGLNQKEEVKKDMKNQFRNNQLAFEPLVGVNFEYKSFCSIFKNLLKPEVENLLRELDHTAV